ncbi:MAG TPA: hypothetical protein VM802_09615 [Chitinophaga sp.]|uniref:hypothetical protein n=1 Tax=Chitinophaga sp. TaxID=1869181 RepID=UPI002C0B67CE|nr:hypothetical protein [Chitinophaga sp.]HVI45119.1 hypothetical protein [Chitinophaga sp.]
MINAATEKKLGHALIIPVTKLAEALDPVKSVQRKSGTGMPAPTAVEQMISNGKKSLATQQTWLATQKVYLATAANQLQKLAKDY